ncbi:MAG: hypothetical protein OXH23_01500 [bacterium]|nr:hypothetical protein [bacterium]
MSDERGEMTPQQMDELASAYLDGEATPEEAAVVESDPRLQELVEELRAVHDLMATPVELPSDEVRDHMIAQALDHRAPVVSLEKARRRLRDVPPQARVILAAAAVVAAIAVVGVTLFDQADRGDDDMMVAEESGPAPAMDDGPAMDMAESAPQSDGAEAPLEAPAEEAMAEEMAMDLDDAPMDDGYAEAEAAAPEPESELMMADEAEIAPIAGEAPLVFETAADLADYAMQLAEGQPDFQGLDRPEDAGAIDLMGCPLFPDEGLELLARFDAVVDEAEVQVSVYFSGSDLQLTETTPPPECELLNSHTFLDWSE